MRRSLVLTAEAARHPFRASLPAHVFEIEEPVREPGRVVVQSPQPSPWRITAQDVREFLLAFCACFLAVSLYIA